MTAADKKKPYYGGIPVRAARDRQVTEYMFRVLVVVAAHDRLNKNSRGCFASQRRLTSIIGGDYTRLNKALKSLEELGYLAAGETDGGPRKQGRSVVYRVVYNGEDRAIMEGENVGSPANIGGQDNIGPAANLPPEIVGSQAEEGWLATQGMLAGKNAKPLAQQANPVVIEQNICSETRKHSAEAAPLRVATGSRNTKTIRGELAANLAKLESSIEAGKVIDVKLWGNYLTSNIDALEEADDKRFLGWCLRVRGLLENHAAGITPPKWTRETATAFIEEAEAKLLVDPTSVEPDAATLIGIAEAGLGLNERARDVVRRIYA